MNLIHLAEVGWLPDPLIRIGIRRLLRKRLQRHESTRFDIGDFVDRLKDAPLAVHTDAANTQHYEAPPEFFQRVLGPRLKYSCCLYDRPDAPLAEAEDAMLRLTCERALLEDGQRVLELGCGWGSLSLWMAERFPNAQITAVSNSNNQRRYIESRVDELGLANLRVITADMRNFAPEGEFDRVVSVEMFEHMRNYELLFRRVEGWLAPAGKVFVHVFCHAGDPYLFETDGADDWMGRHFFTGGTMPSTGLFDRFNADLRIANRWRVGGLDYWRTCEHWLQNLDRSRQSLLDIFGRGLPPDEARIALQRWRMFFLACAELFRYRGGKQWFVEHYLMESVRDAAQPAEDTVERERAPASA
jgi:cyclopropane-fatty-acyl-phospholipid synthase